VADPEIVGEGADLINKSCSRPTGPKFEALRSESRGWVHPRVLFEIRLEIVEIWVV